MFSKAKKKSPAAPDLNAELVEIGDEAQVPATNTKTQPKSSSKMMSSNRPGKAPAKQSSGVPSLISGDVVIRGAIEAEGEVQFDGQLEGDITATGLVIGEGATVKGEVVADKVKVSGTVEGAIRGERVELAATSVVKGDILHKSLSIEAGARFDGQCRYSDNPKSETGKIKKTTARTAPAPRVVQNNDDVPATEEPESTAQMIGDDAIETEASTAPQSSSFLSRAGKSDLR